MRTIATVRELRTSLASSRGSETVALVPTMGAFHDGHVALFAAARASCATVIASLFVNPTQFGDRSDLAAYPRDLARDAGIAAGAGVDILFAPTVEEMYPRGFATWVDVEGPALGFEGEHRPGHFRGVATVVLKLFSIVQPDVVFFGQKDAQQVAVVSQMTRDLNVDIELRVVPTVRAGDGVALSSRNARLSTEERERARAIPRALDAALAAHRAGEDAAAAGREALAGLDIDYVSVAELDGRATLVVAVRIGTTRLIDNVPLDQKAAVTSPAPREKSHV